MRKAVALGLIFLGAIHLELVAQTTAANATPAPPEASQKKHKTEPNKLTNPLGESNQPTTTEIYADEAFFDSNKNMGIFSGHVKVVDPRFNLQSEKLTVYISKGENQGLERAVAEGDVAMVRDRPDANGGAPTRAVGRSDKAVYVSATGNVELSGSPRVQEGLNTHIATSPDTVMIVNQKGELTTHGPSRTEIRQQPKGSPTEGKAEAKPSASPKS